ncbi:MAG: hypothetical protein LBQ62_08410 [Candidatus Accumulibacter sp.]|nr:hypothetical protein [Accumulibacter sp.]
METPEHTSAAKAGAPVSSKPAEPCLEALKHSGFAGMRTEMRIFRRGQKEDSAGDAGGKAIADGAGGTRDDESGELDDVRPSKSGICPIDSAGLPIPRRIPAGRSARASRPSPFPNPAFFTNDRSRARPSRQTDPMPDPFEISPQPHESRGARFTVPPGASALDPRRRARLRAVIRTAQGAEARLLVNDKDAATPMDKGLIDLGEPGAFQSEIQAGTVSLSGSIQPQSAKVAPR